MNADFEARPPELAKRGARFCHNPREAVLEWDAIKTGFADTLECLRAGSFSIIEMSISRVRLQRFIESFGHSLKKRPQIFDAESLKVLSQLERLTLEWIRQAAKTPHHHFVDTPGMSWMGAWQDFCNAYESFSRKVVFELAYQELERPPKEKQRRKSGSGNAGTVIPHASDMAAPESSRNKPGAGEILLKAHLLQHHQYKDGKPPKIGNLNAVAPSGELAKALKISVGTVSSFFKHWFTDRKKYDEYCKRADHGFIGFTLQAMNGDIAPTELRRRISEEVRHMA